MLRRAALLAVALAFPSVARADLTLTDRTQTDARLQELTFSTPSLPKPTHVRVLLPDDYDPSGHTRYPVLYLLHGGAGSYTDWTTSGDARGATAGRKLIVVMPDGGPGGWYTNWYAPGVAGQPQWETYHLDDLLPWIDAHYPTRARRSGRAIAGLSMGGFGAFSYAAQRPDLFAAASEWSGAVDTNTPPLAAAHAIDLISGLDGGLPGSPFGLRETEELNWRAHNPWDLAGNLRGLTLTMHTGNGDAGGPFGGGPLDPLETTVHLMNVSMDARLTALGVPHLYDDYGPGGHLWPYWNRDLREDLPGIMRTFRTRPPAPRAVSYTTVAPVYRMFGWRVSITRAAAEFSTLDDASRRGFTLTGSGTATVVTPADYRPGHAFHVTGAAPATARAGTHGRLRLTVDLDPAGRAVTIAR